MTTRRPAACTLDGRALDGRALDRRGVEAAVAGAHADIGHLVAAALDAGGATWTVTAPLVETLVGPRWQGSPPVVLARALARVQRREAVEAAGQDAALLDRLDVCRRRLRDVLGG